MMTITATITPSRAPNLRPDEDPCLPTSFSGDVNDGKQTGVTQRQNVNRHLQGKQ